MCICTSVAAGDLTNLHILKVSINKRLLYSHCTRKGSYTVIYTSCSKTSGCTFFSRHQNNHILGMRPTDRSTDRGRSENISIILKDL